MMSPSDPRPNGEPPWRRLLERIRPQIFLALLILGGTAGAGIWLSNEVATGTSVGGIIALSMKILESD